MSEQSRTSNNATESHELPHGSHWHHRLVRRAFVERMESELALNGHKGGWNEWCPPGWELMRELNYHCGKLVWAMAQRDSDAVSEFAADVANIAMKADEVLGSSNGE